MIRRITVAPSIRIRHIGILDTSEFYRWVKRWLEFNGYWRDTNEKYIETILPGGAKKIEFTWDCRKNKSTDVIYVITMTFIFVGLRDVEIQKDDKKIKLQRADFDIRMSAALERTGKQSYFMEIYERFIIKKRIEEYKVDLYDKFYGLVEEIKEFLNVYT